MIWAELAGYRVVEGTKKVWSDGTEWAKSNPVATLAITAGVGAGLGLLAGLLIRKSRS